MTISDESNNGTQSIGDALNRMRRRANSEILRRISQGQPLVQALTDLTREILTGNFDAICSPPPPGSSVAQRPSVLALSRVVVDLNAARLRATIAAAPSVTPAPAYNSRASEINLGNTVRNLEPEFSASRLPIQQIATAENSSLRTLSSDHTQNQRNFSNSHRRNAYQGGRTQTTRRSANKQGRATPRRNANERESTPFPEGIVKDPEITPPTRKIANDPGRTPPLRPPPRRTRNDPTRTPPPRPPPRRTRNDSTRTQSPRPPLRRTASDPERTPSPRRIANDPERPPPPRRTTNDPERIQPPRAAIDRERLPPLRRAANNEGTSQNLSRSIDRNIPPHQYDPDTFDPSDLTLKQAVSVMNFFNIDNDREYELIRTSLLRFSIKIYGLEDCAVEDLEITVFFFIERYFNMQPEIEICVRPAYDIWEEDVVGVLFKRCATAIQILERRNTLQDTHYWVSENDECDWIIRNYVPADDSNLPHDDDSNLPDESS